jgi:hypothetical protein
MLRQPEQLVGHRVGRLQHLLGRGRSVRTQRAEVAANRALRLRHTGLRCRRCATVPAAGGRTLLTDLRALLTQLLTLLLPLLHGTDGALLLHLFLSPGLEFRL